jgi:signal transduction protein with GAF and PtsI domain
MADTLTIPASAELVAQIRAQAEARGLTIEQVAQEALEIGVEAVQDIENLDWEEDLRRLEEPGENVPLDEAFDRLDAQVKAARAKAK